MQQDLTTDRILARPLPPSKPPESVADDGRVRIGAGIGIMPKVRS